MSRERGFVAMNGSSCAERFNVRRAQQMSRRGSPLMSPEEARASATA
jgi:hypothetical protein